MNGVLTEQQKIDLIINRGCRYFGILREDLKKKAGNLSHRWKKKRFLIVVLSRYTTAKSSEITTLLGYKSQSNVCYNKRMLEEELSDDFYGNKTTKQTYKELLAYINIKDGELIV